MREYLVIDLVNSKNDFISIWEIIDAIRTESLDGIDESNHIYYYESKEQNVGTGKLINDINNARCEMKRASKAQLKPEYGICLWIQDNAGNDVIEYQYLALIVQKIDNLVCYIYPDVEERVYEVYKEVSCFFSFFAQKSDRRKRVWICRKRGENYGIEMLGMELSNNSYKVFPVMEFEYESTVLENWTKTVATFLEECEASQEILEIGAHQRIAYRSKMVRQYIKSASDKAKESAKAGERKDRYEKELALLQKQGNRLNELSKKSEACRLLCQCINYFVMEPKGRNMEDADRYNEILRGADIQELLQDTSLLAFYILCIQMYFMKSERKLEIEDIRLLLINTEELTEGMIQLLENLQHSSERKGLFSIRIHERKERKNYLADLYPDYDIQKGVSYHFEFRILDYSKYNIVESFKSRNRYNESEISDSFGIKNFFEIVDGDEFWKEYNKKPENLVHHYGLQIFSTIIANNGGRFNVVSSSKSIPNIEKECYYSGAKRLNHERHIPGTEYDILLPMRYDVKPLNPSVDADIQYQFDMRTQFHTVLLDSANMYQKVLKLDDKMMSGQDRKERRIDALKDNILDWLGKQEDTVCDMAIRQSELVVVISAKEWRRNKVEILCKALVLCLIEWRPKNGQRFFVIIKDCTANDFIAIARMFAIFYSKGTLSDHMDRLQIYLSGEDQSEEFIIAGNDLKSLLTMASKLTLVRGIQPYCMKSMEYILHKFQNSKLTKKEVQELLLVPFDILELPFTPETLFEQAVRRVLESDIQKYSFGCKVKHTHMRIGSKLHISEFFEAELLFHNNYYVARFALLILRRLEKEIQKDKPIMFVGYETYSELLLYEIVTNLNAKGYDTSYMVYEQRQKGTFRYYDSIQYLKEKENLAFILIVPINSSMTTHSKLQSWLFREIKAIKGDCEICIAKQYAIILIRSGQNCNERDDMEKRYYTSIREGMITAAFLPEDKNAIHYFVCINTKWHDPLECKFCFPSNSMLDERPLIETNRSSIIPIQMLGIQEKGILNCEGMEKNTVKGRNKEENQKRVEKLGDALLYKHIVRNGNHFMFYFELEKYFIQNRDEIIKWLDGIKNQKKKSSGTIYDVIVAPLHYSNAGFVAEVNYRLYGNAALVLNFEVEKEFRENVRTKYSNVIGLYKKLIDMGNPAELRFHFVDDNIITGNTFYRAKSLFSSLLPVDQDAQVKVKVFDDIIVLLNRMSEASIMNCVQKREDYHAYVFLEISSMRNHEDACTLCKVVENSLKLRNQSATNMMYEYWDIKMVAHRVEKPEECRSVYQEASEYHQRAVRRMLCTHEINERLKSMDYLKNETEEVKKVMLYMLKARKDMQDAMEWIISYVKIFSRPFVSFRKSCQEASFAIMLELIEFMVKELGESEYRLKSNKFAKYGDLKEVCCVIRDALIYWEQSDKVFALLLTLMQRLAVLGSNYAIRKENIRKLFLLVEIFIRKSYISSDEWEKFIQKYISNVKRIVCLSSDENKCIYLEYIILFGEEYCDNIREKEVIGRVTDKMSGLFLLRNSVFADAGKEFLEILFLENTRVLYDGIHDLNRGMNMDMSLNNLRMQLEDKYYFKNFKRLLRYYRFIEEEAEKVNFVGNCDESILAMVKLYRMLSESGRDQEERDVETFYNNLLDYVEIITDTKAAKLLIPAVRTDHVRVVYKKQSKMEIEPEENDYDKQKFVYDTYAISVQNNGDTHVLIKYRNYAGSGYSEKNKIQMGEVYLELQFPNNVTRLKMMIALKSVMVFRALIVKNLEKDFSNNLMQKWSAEQYFKKNMKLERSSDHMDKDELADNLKLISQGMDGCEKKYQKALFELVINSYIARFNVQLLVDAHPEGENQRCKFAYIYRKQLRALLDVLHNIENFKILDEAGEECFSKKVLDSYVRMYKDERRHERLSIRRLSIIVVELVLSAIKYSDDQVIQIYRENDYLVAKNTFISEKDIAVIKQEAHDSSSRKKEGISLAVIKELVDRFYLLDKDSGVIIDAEEVDGVKYYFVKLPILAD